MSTASLAETGSAVIINAAAFCIPTNLGKKKVPPLSGINPILLKACMNEALSVATTISHAKAILAPAPAATPFTAATIGFSIFLIFLMIGL